ncbi:endospore germination permease [Desulfotomaculum defluvii]
MKQMQISNWQLCLLIIGTITVMGHLYIVPLVLDAAGRDVLISLLISLVMGIVLVLLLSGLARIKPQHSLDQIAISLFGKPVGNFIGLIYTVYFLLPPALGIRGLMEFMKTAFLNQTPKGLIGVSFLILCLFAVRSGLESIVRTYAILMPILIFIGILAAVLAAPDKEYNELLPLLEQGILPSMLGSIPLIGLLGELVVLGSLHSSIRKPTSIWKYNLVIVLVIGVLFIGPLTGPVAMFGEGGVTRFDYPTYAEMKFGSYLVSYQSLAVILWIFGSFGRISIFYYIATVTAARLLNLASYRWLVVPTGMVIFLLAHFAFPDLFTVKKFLVISYPIMALILGIILPAILFIGLSIKNKN